MPPRANNIPNPAIYCGTCQDNGLRKAPSTAVKKKEGLQAGVDYANVASVRGMQFKVQCRGCLKADWQPPAGNGDANGIDVGDANLIRVMNPGYRAEGFDEDGDEETIMFLLNELRAGATDATKDTYDRDVVAARLKEHRETECFKYDRQKLLRGKNVPRDLPLTFLLPKSALSELSMPQLLLRTMLLEDKRGVRRDKHIAKYAQAVEDGTFARLCKHCDNGKWAMFAYYQASTKSGDLQLSCRACLAGILEQQLADADGVHLMPDGSLAILNKFYDPTSDNPLLFEEFYSVKDIISSPNIPPYVVLLAADPDMSQANYLRHAERMEEMRLEKSDDDHSRRKILTKVQMEAIKAAGDPSPLSEVELKASIKVVADTLNHVSEEDDLVSVLYGGVHPDSGEICKRENLRNLVVDRCAIIRDSQGRALKDCDNLLVRNVAKPADIDAMRAEYKRGGYAFAAATIQLTRTTDISSAKRSEESGQELVHGTQHISLEDGTYHPGNHSKVNPNASAFLVVLIGGQKTVREGDEYHYCANTNPGYFIKRMRSRREWCRGMEKWMPKAVADARAKMERKPSASAKQLPAPAPKSTNAKLPDAAKKSSAAKKSGAASIAKLPGAAKKSSAAKKSGAASITKLPGATKKSNAASVAKLSGAAKKSNAASVAKPSAAANTVKPSAATKKQSTGKPSKPKQKTGASKTPKRDAPGNFSAATSSSKKQKTNQKEKKAGQSIASAFQRGIPKADTSGKPAASKHAPSKTQAKGAKSAKSGQLAAGWASLLTGDRTFAKTKKKSKN